MKKYIKAKDNENIPIILQGSNVKEVELRNLHYVSLYKETQFIIEHITDLSGNYYHGSNNRLRQFTFGKGILWDRNYGRIVAIFMEGQRIAVLNDWVDYWGNEFTKFKKALREARYNTKKCFVYVDDFSDFVCDPLAPKFLDYSEDYQRSVTRVFLEKERLANAPVEEVVEHFLEATEMDF